MQTNSAEETKKIAASFVDGLQAKETATILALFGDLGAGKTTFVQGVAEALGVADPITSPTFVIQKTYPLTEKKFKHLVHVDAYRLEKPRELEVLGWSEICRDAGNLICVEWPEHVEVLLPEDAQHLVFTYGGDSNRTILLPNEYEQEKA